MFIDEPWTEVKEFINQLDEQLSQGQSGPRLSITQKAWLGFCLMGLTNNKLGLLGQVWTCQFGERRPCSLIMDV